MLPKPLVLLLMTKKGFPAVLPGYMPVPGSVDERVIYSAGLQKGWRIDTATSTGVALQETPVNGSKALCAMMYQSQVRMRLSYHARLDCLAVKSSV